MIKEINGMIEDAYPVFINNSRQKQQTVFVKPMDEGMTKKLTLFGNKISSFIPTSEHGKFKFDCEVRNAKTKSGKHISYYNVIGFTKLEN